MNATNRGGNLLDSRHDSFVFAARSSTVS